MESRLLSAEKGVELLEEVTINAKREQTNVLTEILKKNSNVEYLQRHGLNGKTNIESFKAHIPIISYQDVETAINRIADGDRSPILCADPVTELISSTGTSKGRSKFFPTTEEQCKWIDHVIHLKSCIRRHFIQSHANEKDAYLVFVNAGTKTAGELPKHFVVASYIKRNCQYLQHSITSVPEALLCEDTKQSMYAHLLAALVQRDAVATITTTFASLLLRFITFLREHWASLCHDISTGTVNDTLVHSLRVRDSLTKILNPNPELAQTIHNECSNESWKGIVKRLWPTAKCVEATMTGTMAQYVPELQFYCGDGLPLVSMVYGCSEGFFGLNLNPMCEPKKVWYTLLPHVAYYEFIPQDGDQTNNVVDLMGLEIDKTYEIVVTTIAGLYRYRIGDVLRVKGFYNNAPMFEFVCRKNTVISVHLEKTDESELQKAMANASSRHLEALGVSVVDYTAYADASTSPGHYVLFVEISDKEDSSDGEGMLEYALEKFCDTMEESLSDVYRHYRKEGLIGALEVRRVGTATFLRLMEAAIANGASVTQYKTPRAINNNEMLQLLQAHVSDNYYSTCIPH